MVEVTVREGETLEQALKRFRRKIRKEGLMDEIRGRLHYEKPSIRKRRKKRRAQDRAQQNPVEKSRPETVLRNTSSYRP